MRKGRQASPKVGGSAVRGVGGQTPRSASPKAPSSARSAQTRKSPGGSETRTPLARAKSAGDVDGRTLATPPSQCKGGETPRTPLGNLASSPNVPPTPATDGALDSPYFASGESGSPGWILNDGTPGLSDSAVSEHADHLVEALMREPTDEDVRQELLSALKARRENEALRDHIEHLKNGEVDQGLEASKRMAQMSAEYMARVDEITRERNASRARAVAAEEKARELAAYMRSSGFGTPLAQRPEASTSADDDAPRVLENEGDISIGGDGVSASLSATMETAVPAANLFASPVLVNDPLDCIGTPGPNADSGTCADASFDFGGGDTAPSTATVFTGDRRGSDAASVESMDDESLRTDASRVARSIETPEATSRISNNGSTGVFVAPTPSGAGAEDAARVAMAGMDHPTLVNEASNLVAANVRLERERRALVERLEKLQRTKPPSTPTVSRPPPATPSADTAAPFPSVATPGVFLTPGGGAAPAAETSARRGASAGESPVAAPSPRGVPSWDMLGTSFAAAQMSEAIDRVKAAADEAAALLDPDRENGAESGGATAGGGGGGGGTPTGHPGGTLDRALRRMRAHGHKVMGDEDEEDRRRRARELALGMAQAASLASMQRERMLEVMEVERRQARKEATDAFAAMGRALERTRGERSFVGSSPASRETAEVTVSDIIVTPPAPEEPGALARAVQRAETAERELAEVRRAAAAAAAKAEERHIELQYESAARERDAARLAVELEAATNAAEAAQDVAERRQRQAASLEAKHTRLSMELSAALQKLRETERDVLAEKRRLSLSFRTNHRHVGGVISASPLVLVGGAMDVVATPPDLAPINVGTPSSDSDASAGSPVLSALARRVSATREELAAALAAAEASEREDEDAADETAALVRDLRAQLEASRAEAAKARDSIAAAEARAEEAEQRAVEASAAAAAAAAKALVAASPSPPSPSPSPIARKSNRADVSALLDGDALERAAGNLGMDDDADANAAALTWARRAEAAARDEAEEARNVAAAARAEASSASTSLETARGELERLRRDFASESAERERLGARVEELQEREAELRLSLEETEQELRSSRERQKEEERDEGERRSSLNAAEKELRAETTRLAASLAEANARADRSRDDVERAKAAMREWKDQQSAAVAKWMEESSARARAAEDALAAANARAETSREDPSHASASALLAENRELIAEAERQAKQAEALEIRVAELVTRAEAAESAAADAPHLRSENYDLAVKHREGLRRIQKELAARRKLEDRVVEYEGAVKALEATVQQLEGALSESLEMCASARTASAAAASARAAEQARATMTPTPAKPSKAPADDAGSCDGSSSSPAPGADVTVALAAALAAKESMSAALEAAERAAAASREETTRANAAAKAAELEAEAARAVAESRRADLAVLRDECNALRMKVVDMEEDARVSPSPRHGGPPPRPLSEDSPFASMKSFSRLAANAADADAFDLADGFVDPDATMMSVVTPERSPAPAPVPAAGGDLRGAAVAGQIMSLTPPSSASPASESAAPPPSDADGEDERASFKAVASLALLASTLKSKADVLLTASSGSSEASGSAAGSPGTAAANGARAESSESEPLARSVSDLIQTETWLDQAISAAERLRSENANLERRVEEIAAEARLAVADAAAARDEATAATSRADEADRRADTAERRATELEAELENSAKRVRALVDARATEDLVARESSAFAARSAEAEARARAEEAMAAKAKVRELQASRRALEDAAAEASAARAAAECEAARARNEASEARAEAMREAAAAEAAHDARRRAEETASRLAEAAAAAAAEAAASSPSPPPLIYTSPPRARATTEEAGTCTTPLALPAPAGPLAASPLAPAGGDGKFAEALRAYTKRLRDDVTKAEAEVAAHREHAEKMRLEIARLASDLPSERREALRLATPKRDGDVDAATAENTAMNVAATGGKAEARAVYYKTIAKKCYQRMKQQKSAYETQIDGLRRQIEFAGMGSLNLTNASFASTAVTPSRAKTPMGDGNGNGNGVTFADDLPDLGSPDVDDVNLRLGGFLK